MQWDTISDQWLWIGAAAVLIILVAALAIHSLKPKSHDKEKTKPNGAGQNGWALTGRIDFVDPQSKGDFILQVEEILDRRQHGGNTAKSNGEKPGWMRQRQY